MWSLSVANKITVAIIRASFITKTAATMFSARTVVFYTSTAGTHFIQHAITTCVHLQIRRRRPFILKLMSSSCMSLSHSRSCFQAFTANMNYFLKKDILWPYSSHTLHNRPNKNSSGDEIATWIFLRRYCTRTSKYRKTENLIRLTN